jgi:hypothetical protein
MEINTNLPEPRIAPATGPGEPPGQLSVERREEMLFTLADAFCFHQTENRNTFDLEKAIRSVSYQLDWLSRGGNESVSGISAQGLSETLNRCADEVRRLFTWDDIFALDANPPAILKAKRAAGNALPVPEHD